MDSFDVVHQRRVTLYQGRSFWLSTFILISTEQHGSETPETHTSLFTRYPERAPNSVKSASVGCSPPSIQNSAELWLPDF